MGDTCPAQPNALQLAVTLVAVYVPPLAAVRHDVASGTGILDPYLACHWP
jgi:hypothetical protein